MYMKKIIYLLIPIFIASFNIVHFTNNAYAENYYYTTVVEHLFTHCLISYPEKILDKNNHMKKHLLNDCITTNEFNMVLESLYKNNYVLVSINDCFETKNKIAVKKKIKIPNGKKAIILGFDDVNYDSKKLGMGMVDKIIVDNNNNIASLTQINKKQEISYDKEFVNVLENFIKKYPDFSPFGAKGCINLTGYDGILGYRTSHTNAINRQEEIQQATNVVKKLKELNWDFASHSYGHYHMKKISIDKFKNELEMWKTEVEPIVGKTQVYVYPYGEWEVFKNNDLCEKHKLLNQYGFKLFCGVGMKSYYSYLPTKTNNKVLFMDRKCIDGYTLSTNSKYLTPFFKPLEVLDNLRKNIKI